MSEIIFAIPNVSNWTAGPALDIAQWWAQNITLVEVGIATSLNDRAICLSLMCGSDFRVQSCELFMDRLHSVSFRLGEMLHEGVNTSAVPLNSTSTSWMVPLNTMSLTGWFKSAARVLMLKSSGRLAVRIWTSSVCIKAKTREAYQRDEAEQDNKDLPHCRRHGFEKYCFDLL